MKVSAVPSVEVTIRCNGTALHEYEHEDDNDGDTRTGVRYIEATSGSNFSVSIKSNNYDCSKWSHVACEVKLDGRTMNTHVVEVHRLPRYDYELLGAQGMLEGRYVRQRYQFADLSTNDESTARAKIDNFKSLGEIQINLFACRKIRDSDNHYSIPSTADGSVPEKCLKGRAISNKAILGEPESLTSAPKACQVQWADASKPFATYLFRYRSRKDLQIEGLIPRSPLPVPLEERDPDDLSPEEARELIRLMRTQGRENKVKIKSEKRSRPARDDNDDDDEDFAVVEERSKRARLSTDSAVEIVDLTEEG